MKRLKCPNCGEDMDLEGVAEYQGRFYDKWTCRDCVHIIVLDYIAELNDKQTMEEYNNDRTITRTEQ